MDDLVILRLLRLHMPSADLWVGRLRHPPATIPAEVRPDDATLAEWMRHCKRNGLYAQGKLLYERGGLNLDKLSEEEQVNVEEDYQVCARGLSQPKASPGHRPSRERSSNRAC